MKRFLALSLFCAALLLTPSCQGKKKAAAPADTTARTETVSDTSAALPPLVANQPLNSSARLLAGLPLAEDDPLYGMTQTPEWEQHRAKMDEMWAKSKETLDQVDSIRRKDLTDITERAENVLYAFSGPDFPFVAAFFPEAKTYVLMGLEKTGSPIDGKKAGERMYKKYEEALLWMLQKSYFVTSYMSGDLNNAEIDGTIPILTVLMTRMGYEILSVVYQELTSEGEWQDKSGRSPFVRIDYFAPGDTEPKSLYYLSTDISDKKFDPRVQQMLAGLDPDKTAAFVKSCSYCLHYGSFSQIREDILDHSFALIQDDTGITYKTLLSRGLEVTLYGSYTEPIDLFPRGVFQKDLDQAYKERTDIRPLGFRFGYNYKGSSLIVSRRPAE